MSTYRFSIARCVADTAESRAWEAATKSIDDNGRRAVVFRLEVPATTFTPGTYTGKGNVIHAGAGKVAFPRMQFQVW